MGKKSSAKKKKRQQKHVEHQKKHEEAKKLNPEEEIEKKKKRRQKHKKIFGGIFALIMLTVLAAVSFLIFQKTFQPTSIAKFLPAEKTVAFIDLNTNFEHKQLENTLNLLAKYPDYSKEKIIELFNKKYTLNFSGDIDPWLGRRAGVALVYSDDNTLNKVYFAEVYSGKIAEEYFADGSEMFVHGFKNVYATTRGFFATIIKDQVFISESQTIIKEIIDFQNNSEKRLFDDPNFRRVDDNLPISKLAYIYIDFKKIHESFFEYFPVLAEKGITSGNIQPILKFFNAEGVAIIALKDKFGAQSFIALDTDNVDENKYFAFKEKYQANLSHFVPDDTIAFWGGVNLEYQTKRMLEILSNNNESLIETFDSVFQTYTNKYFGPDVSFKEDILPLFKNEFALAIEQANNKNIFKVLIQLEDTKNDSVALHEIAKKFAEIGAVFQPKVVERILEDGTITQEIMAVPEKIEITQSTYNSYTIYEMEIGKESSWGIYFTIIDNIAVVSTHKEGIISSIDCKNGNKKSLRLSPKYSLLINPILSSSDEITYFNLEEFIGIVSPDSNFPDLINDIESFASGKNYFYDGVASLSFLTLK